MVRGRRRVRRSPGPVWQAARVSGTEFLVAPAIAVSPIGILVPVLPGSVLIRGVVVT